MSCAKKHFLGQFFTTKTLWLRPHILDFILNSGCSVAYDPFAGNGDILSACSVVPSIKSVIGCDIDVSLSWTKNDSLLHIPEKSGAIIITNPPYLSNYSAARKGLKRETEKYFRLTEYDDLYLMALDRMLDAQKHVVAIIPETFKSSSYKRKNLLQSLTILEENPFTDTDTPVCIACFDGENKKTSKIKVYKNDRLVCHLADLENKRLLPKNDVRLRFNSPDGWLGVRCVDTTDPENKLRFDFKENIDYDWERGIKVSSRLLTLVDIDVPRKRRALFVKICNKILNAWRQDTEDVILSPFKGNMKDGHRRRRLDFMTCRAIMELAYKEALAYAK